MAKKDETKRKATMTEYEVKADDKKEDGNKLRRQRKKKNTRKDRQQRRRDHKTIKTKTRKKCEDKKEYDKNVDD